MTDSHDATSKKHKQLYYAMQTLMTRKSPVQSADGEGPSQKAEADAG